MKKLAIFLVLMVFVFSGSAYADFKGPGAPEPDSAASAKKAQHGTLITLEGHIVQQLGHERYLFRDGTGQVRVAIPNRYWQGQEVTPKTKIRISGAIVRDVSGIEIEVWQVEVVAE